MPRIEPIMERNFLEYASYTILDRAIPDVRDGLKPVQRRILYTLKQMDDGKLHKVANVIGETMKLHPHGDASIGEALVNLANKEYFIEKQGNFGNILTGHRAAAARYIECRLTALARETMFSKALMEFRPSYDGRRMEPLFLPSKLPLAILLGTDGIAVGMSTRILPHNLGELLQAQISILRGESACVYPDFPTAGIADVSEYDHGRGKIRVRATIEKLDDKTLAIRDIPYTTTTEQVISSVEGAAHKGKVKIASIDDFTTDRVEIQIGLPRGVHADEVLPQLYAYTNCEVSITSNMVVIKDNKPQEMSVEELLLFLTDHLKELIRLELEHQLAQLLDQKHWLDLEALFIENRIYKRIEEARSEKSVKREVQQGLEPYLDQLDREVSDDDLARLLALPIRRISLYDINRNRNSIKDVLARVKETRDQLADLVGTTIAYLEGLLEKFAHQYPRRTRIKELQTVDVRSVARQNIKVAYDPETGFFGSEVKGNKYQFTMSEYDRVLVVCQDGSFKIIGPENKILIPGKVIHAEVFDQESGRRLLVVYRDTNRIAFAKRIHIRRFVRDREYELIRDKQGRIDHLQALDKDPESDPSLEARLQFVPRPRQRKIEDDYDLDTLKEVGVGARGTRLTSKPVLKVVVRRQRPAIEPPGEGDSSDNAASGVENPEDSEDSEMGRQGAESGNQPDSQAEQSTDRASTPENDEAAAADDGHPQSPPEEDLEGEKSSNQLRLF